MRAIILNFNFIFLVRRRELTVPLLSVLPLLRHVMTRCRLLDFIKTEDAEDAPNVAPIMTALS